MDKDYFNSLKNSVQDSERPVNNVTNPTDQTLLTVKVDINCKVYCDGDFLDLLEANKAKHFTIETGPHLITIESEKYEDLVEDREIDAKGRNNLVVIKDMKQKEQEYLQKEEEKDYDNDLNTALETQVSKNKEYEGVSKMILKTKIEFITHNEIVCLLLTAIDGSTYLSAEYDKDFYNSIPENKRHGSCHEDKMADVLLNGGEIYIYDNDSEGEIYGIRKATVTTNKYGEKRTQYTITLADLIDGLEKCINSTYKVQNDSKYLKQCFDEFVDEDSCSFDIEMADALMQVIVFNELAYG